MKRIFAICAVGAFYVLMASYSFEKSNTLDFLTQTPVLPTVPYDYDINYPEHGIFGGYATIDTALANSMITKHGATLGRVLFYDKQLSVKNTISCGSCHHQQFAFADTARFSAGLDGHLTPRNSPTIADLSWGSGSIFFEGTILFWDCRQSSLEGAVLEPIQDAHELGKDLVYMNEKLSRIDYYQPLFENAFGDSEVTTDRVAAALSQFIRSMTSFDSKYDEAKKGKATFSYEEARGEEIFINNCAKGCHIDHSFSTPFPRNNGLDLVSVDEGLGGWNGRAGDIGKFKSQTLRNVAITPPYMHDGRFQTLEEVIDFYSDDVQLHPNSDFRHLQHDNFTGFNFTNDEKKHLLAFLQTLTTSKLLTHPKWSNPFDASSSNDDNELANSIHVFPNPVMDQLLIDLGSLSAKKVDLSLYDLNGKLVWENQMSTSSADFKMDKLQTGVYILQLNIEGQIVSKKLFFR